jgi:HAD superfamily hydrolase (TIGR01509 family)
MMKIKAIIFDNEGVVIDTESLWDLSQIEFFDRRGLEYSRDIIKPQLVGKSLREGSKILKNIFKLNEDEEVMAIERREIMKLLLAKKVEYIRGFQKFFRFINDMKWVSCIATSMDPELFSVVNTKLQLDSFFDRNIYFIADVNYLSKPNPAVFLHAAKKLNIPFNECLVIEDSPPGILAASQAGMFSIALTTTFNKTAFNGLKCNFIAESFIEIEDFLLCQQIG